MDLDHGVVFGEEHLDFEARAGAGFPSCRGLHQLEILRRGEERDHDPGCVSHRPASYRADMRRR